MLSLSRALLVAEGRMRMAELTEIYSLFNYWDTIIFDNLHFLMVNH